MQTCIYRRRFCTWPTLGDSLYNLEGSHACVSWAASTMCMVLEHMQLAATYMCVGRLT
jgi:hypothetical protein